MDRRGQTILEYTILIGFVVLAIYYMGPAFKRGLQSLIKATADQIGDQSQADQTVKRHTLANGEVVLPEDDQSDAFLAKAQTQMTTTGNRLTSERIYVTDTDVNERTTTSSKAVTDLGFSK